MILGLRNKSNQKYFSLSKDLQTVKWIATSLYGCDAAWANAAYLGDVFLSDTKIEGWPQGNCRSDYEARKPDGAFYAEIYDPGHKLKLFSGYLEATVIRCGWTPKKVDGLWAWWFYTESGIHRIITKEEYNHELASKIPYKEMPVEEIVKRLDAIKPVVKEPVEKKG